MHILNAKRTETQYTVELLETEIKIIMAALWHYYAAGGKTNGITQIQAHTVYDSFSLEKERLGKS